MRARSARGRLQPTRLAQNVAAPVAVLCGAVDSVSLHLLDLGGDISGNGLSKLFLTIAAAFAEAERDRIRERIGQVKADQKARGRYLGGIVPSGYRRGEHGQLATHEAEQAAVHEMVGLRAQGEALRAIAKAMQAKGFKISHEGVKGVIGAHSTA